MQRCVECPRGALRLNNVPAEPMSGLCHVFAHTASMVVLGCSMVLSGGGLLSLGNAPGYPGTPLNYGWSYAASSCDDGDGCAVCAITSS